MTRLHNHLPFLDELPAEERSALRAAMAGDEALAEAFAHWQQARQAIREQLDRALPYRRCFVLYGLEAAGRAGELSDDERRELEAARSQFERALRAHPGLSDIIRDVEYACADFDTVWNEHFGAGEATRRKERDRLAAARVHRPPVMRRWGWRALAAAAVVVFGVVSVMVFLRDAGLQTIEVAEGTTRLVELADGSTVRLFGGSTLTFTAPEQASAFNRRVRLEGRAFFDIVPDQQGFTVEAPTAVTTVLGTSFGMQAGDEQMEVVLASGRLAVAPREAQDRLVVLEPGQRSRVARNALPTTPEPVDLSEALEWTGLLVFRMTPVADVAERLEERYEVTIDLPAQLAKEKFTGTFTPEQRLEQVLDVVATTLDARVERAAGAGYRLVQDE